MIQFIAPEGFDICLEAEKKKKRFVFTVSFSLSFVCSLKCLGCLYFETWKVEWMFGI